jgi:hypothetical protein
LKGRGEREGRERGERERGGKWRGGKIIQFRGGKTGGRDRCSIAQVDAGGD